MTARPKASAVFVRESYCELDVPSTWTWPGGRLRDSAGPWIERALAGLCGDRERIGGRSAATALSDDAGARRSADSAPVT
jgi:hypothetical protein